MEDCIFCKIIEGKLPSYKIFEDEMYLGFLDIFPRTKGHSLLIPKKHYRWVYDVTDFGTYWEKVLIVTNAMKKAFNPSFITYVTHGLEVPHAHIHILPRFHEKEFVPEIKKFPKSELETIAKEIRNNIV